MINVVFFMWVMRSIDTIMGQLREEKQTFKLRLYGNLFYIMSLAMISGFLLTVFELAYPHGDEFNAVWAAVYLICVLDIAILWRPSSMSSMLAHS
jgi:hypothetical protein